MDLRIFGKKTLTVAPDGWLPAAGDRAGILSTKPWFQHWVESGYVFIAHFGTDTTPVALETAFDADQPDLCVDFANTVVSVPLFFEVSPEATGGAGFECHLMVSPIAVGAGTSTALTPLNLLVNATNASVARASRTYTGNGTDPSTGARWLRSFSVNQDLDATGIRPHFTWSCLEAPAPVLAGTGTTAGYSGSFNAYMYNGTSGTAFARFIWAELPGGYLS